MCRALFAKYKACLTLSGVNQHRADVDAIKIISKSLQDDTEHADISDIIRQLHQEIDNAIETRADEPRDGVARDKPGKLYDISQIDFERLRQEFARSRAQRTTTQKLRHAVELRLQRLLAQNPLTITSGMTRSACPRPRITKSKSTTKPPPCTPTSTAPIQPCRHRITRQHSLRRARIRGKLSASNRHSNIAGRGAKCLLRRCRSRQKYAGGFFFV